ncbi:hypothetical protein AX16_004533 [Volvariella volvacea WC 439]|nr:hypothetical protein AX16_004533 [Volvariella volvacea WC 439]
MDEELYNSLPLLEDANRHFNDRSILNNPELERLFADHPAYGVCLVYRHYTLEKEEKMVTFGAESNQFNTVTSPRSLEDIKQDLYPHAWLADGTPFEFSQSPALEKPSQLLQRFGEIVYPPGIGEGVNTWKNRPILGIRYVGTSAILGARTHRTGPYPEWIVKAEERKNYLRRVVLDNDIDKLGVDACTEICWCAIRAEPPRLIADRVVLRPSPVKDDAGTITEA